MNVNIMGLKGGVANPPIPPPLDPPLPGLQCQANMANGTVTKMGNGFPLMVSPFVHLKGQLVSEEYKEEDLAPYRISNHSIVWSPNLTIR